jgi:hypothetical protein
MNMSHLDPRADLLNDIKITVLENKCGTRTYLRGKLKVW